MNFKHTLQLSLLTACFILLISLNANAQFKKPKFGAVTMDELNMTSHPLDSSANAIILFDNGYTSFNFNKANGHFFCETKRHTRIKIFTVEGLEWAENSISLYKNNSEKETVSGLKGFTYNNVGGKIEKVKLTKNSIFSDEISEFRTLQKFTMPQAKAGSVIEFEYTVISPFILNLDSWSFQTDIPTVYSHYEIGIPEYYTFKLHMTGYQNVQTKEETKRESITFTSLVKEGFYVTKTTSQSNTIEYQTNYYNFVAENIPSFSREPYIDNKKNYQSRVNFELLSTQYPNEPLQTYTTTWPTVVEKMLENEKFGKQLTSSRFIRDDLNEIISSNQPNKEKVEAIISFLKAKVKWNNYYGCFAYKGVREAYKSGSGNSAELNFLLILALREAGINAYPIALSTRSNGIIHPWQVSIDGFNHTITGIELDQELMLYDATSKFSNINILPLNSINGQGRLIDKEKDKWVNLNPSKPSRKTEMVEITLQANGDAKGTVISAYRDYFAQNINEQIDNEDKVERFKENIVRNLNNATIDSLTFEKNQTAVADVKCKFIFESSNYASPTGDLFIFTPGNGFLITKNSFDANERKLPINFHFPRDEYFIIKIIIPDGYEVDEFPTPLTLNQLNNRIQYQYAITPQNNELTLISRLRINNTLFLQTEYYEFKKFYDAIVSKNMEKIVLKKKIIKTN
jgi:hypothetical protein